MQAAQGSLGRVFVLRLEDGDVVPDCIEQFAAENAIMGGYCALLGGVGGGRLVVGPSDVEEDGDMDKIIPMVLPIRGIQEAAAVGTIFADSTGTPKLHMHTTLGRNDKVMTGCVRQGVNIWKIAEAVIFEILDTGLCRKPDPVFGFDILSKD